MIGATHGPAVENEIAPFLARSDDKVPPFVGENYGRDVHVQISPCEPDVIAGRVIVLEGQLVIRKCERLDTGGELAGGGIVGTIAGLKVDRSIRAYRGSGGSPQARLGWGGDSHFAVLEVDRVEGIGHAAATLTGDRVKHVLDQVQSVRLAVGHGKNLNRRVGIAARGQVHDVQVTIAGEHI